MELVPVRVRDCACPDSPHPDGDVVFITAKISFDGGLQAEQDVRDSLIEAIDRRGGEAEGVVPEEVSQDAAQRLRRRWLVTYVRYGAVGWNLVDENGPVPFDVEYVLSDYELAKEVADAAADRYTGAVSVPLALGQKSRSVNGQTARRTSRTRASTRSPRKASSPGPTAGKRSAASP